MTISIADILFLLITCGILVISNGFLVGWLVYRSKREAHEPLAPQKREPVTQRAVNLDEFAIEDDPGLAAVTKANLGRMNEAFGIDILKDEKKQ